MENTPYSPAGTPSESLAAFPANDSGQPPDALTEAPSAFDPADWLATFEGVGGGWAVREHLSFMIRVEDQSDEAIISARLMVVSLTPEHRKAILAHLCEREA